MGSFHGMFSRGDSVVLGAFEHTRLLCTIHALLRASSPKSLLTRPLWNPLAVLRNTA